MKKPPQKKSSQPPKLETYGGPYHRFESDFQQRPPATAKKEDKRGKENKGKRKKRA